VAFSSGLQPAVGRLHNLASDSLLLLVLQRLTVVRNQRQVDGDDPDLDGLARSMAYELEFHWAYDPKTMKNNPGYKS